MRRRSSLTALKVGRDHSQTLALHLGAALAMDGNISF